MSSEMPTIENESSREETVQSALESLEGIKAHLKAKELIVTKGEKNPDSEYLISQYLNIRKSLEQLR